ncbi:hypothetical protein GQ43DRAFT_224807 [Delitschia confertaspora ATCC 74209]|uniref:Cation-transporting P-type ATPase N-terminal domain-containing protein n=1 Tax=Delitschia confertaspora ATCC 74209 TaxID=1513339 RepID=A0A9P4JQW6_9PLEO|nr:hypothetical protein GQ43DRAFT_224807 [Delitschia confertaspora ATCC 74209]
MGEEDCLPTVEESTEPPIGAQQSGNYHGRTTAGQQASVQANHGYNSMATFLPSAHTFTADQVAAALGVDLRHGLRITEAELRLQSCGLNKVKGAEGLSVWEILLRQVSNSLTLAWIILYAKTWKNTASLNDADVSITARP